MGYCKTVCQSISFSISPERFQKRMDILQILTKVKKTIKTDGKLSLPSVFSISLYYFSLITHICLLFFNRLHRREEHNIPDRRCIRYKHNYSVNSDAKSACRRQPYFQCIYKIKIHRMRFIIFTAVKLRLLLSKSLILINWVIQLGKCICNLPAVDIRFKSSCILGSSGSLFASGEISTGWPITNTGPSR